MIVIGNDTNRHGIWAIFFADKDLWTSRPVVTWMFPRTIIFCTYDSGWFGQCYIRLWGWEFTIQMSTKLFDFMFDQFYAS